MVEEDFFTKNYKKSENRDILIFFRSTKKIYYHCIVHYDTCDLSSTFLHGVKLGPECSEGVFSFPSDDSGCCNRRVLRVVGTRQRQQGSGIDVGSRLGKLFLVSNLSNGWAQDIFLLLQVSVAATGLTGTNYGHCCRLSLEYGNIVCIIYF